MATQWQPNDKPDGNPMTNPMANPMAMATQWQPQWQPQWQTNGKPAHGETSSRVNKRASATTISTSLTASRLTNPGIRKAATAAPSTSSPALKTCCHSPSRGVKGAAAAVAAVTAGALGAIHTAKHDNEKSATARHRHAAMARRPTASLNGPGEAALCLGRRPE